MSDAFFRDLDMPQRNPLGSRRPLTPRKRRSDAEV